MLGSMASQTRTSPARKRAMSAGVRTRRAGPLARPGAPGWPVSWRELTPGSSCTGAAAASVALRDRDRLAEDHDLARYLAAELAARQPDLVDPETVETNIVNIRAAAISRPWPQLAAEFEREPS